MSDIKNIEFTDDPLTNIKMMIPALNEESRQKVSYFLYGYVLAAAAADSGDLTQSQKTG